MKEKVLPLPTSILKSGHTSPEEYKELWETITSGRVWRGHFFIFNRKKNGETYWESASIAPITDSEGAITHFVAVKQDITERKQADAERERLLAQLRDATLSSIPDAVIIDDPTGRIVRMNPAAERMYRYTAEELELSVAERLARRRVETPDGKPFPVDQSPLPRALRGETVRGVVAVLHLPDGETRWVSTSAAPILAADGTILGAVGTSVDITELHRLQQRQEDLARTISHDLRTSLTAIQGHAQVLQQFLEKAGVDGRARRSTECGCR